MSKIKQSITDFLYQNKTYTYCVLVMVAVPLIHKFYKPLSFEFILGFEFMFGALIFIRHAIGKIHGHRNEKYLL